jgi:Rrf2 family transcriptional regulator, iron-sulfur cluster assembly transcription factor
MRLTTKGRFAVTAMIDVAMHEKQGPVALAEVSERQHISLSYLEQLFAKLRRRGIVDSVRGPGGGYTLARPAGVLSVAEIIVAVDEPIDSTSCGGKENCHDDGRQCLTHDLWANLNNHIYKYLSDVTLDTLVAKANKKDSGANVPVALIDNRPRYRRASTNPGVLM